MRTNNNSNLAPANFIHTNRAPVTAGPNRDEDTQTRDCVERKCTRSAISTAPKGVTNSSLDKIAHLFNQEIISHRSLGGGENFVYLINDQWIFRAPKKAAALCANQREQILLKELN